MSSSLRFAVTVCFFVPLFLGLSLHGGRCRVLELSAILAASNERPSLRLILRRMR
jgi:hypothetical protein